MGFICAVKPLVETQCAEIGASEVTLHREVLENCFSILYSRRGWKQLQPKSRAVRTPVAITTGTGAGLDHSCSHPLLRLPGIRKVNSLQKCISKRQVVNEDLILCSRWFLLNRTAEKCLIKKSILGWEPKRDHFR